jgi:hypothetical protein
MFSQYWVANVPGATITSTQATVLQGLSNVSASANEINNRLDGSNMYVSLTTAAASETIDATNTGRIHLMGNTIASTLALLLPAEADGLYYKFVYVGAAAEASNITIGTEAAANFFVGGLAHFDVGSANTAVATVYSDGNSNSLITLVTPAAGTVVEVLCNGTSWYLWGQSVSATIPTIADT